MEHEDWMHQLTVAMEPLTPQEGEAEAGLDGEDYSNAILASLPLRKKQKILAQAARLKTILQPDALNALLTELSPELRPILLSAVLDELANAGDLDESVEEASPLTIEQLTQRSKILQILQKPYQPFFAQDILDLLKGKGLDGLMDHPTANSTLRNMLLAKKLEEFLKESPWTVALGLANYTWEQWAADCAKGRLPTLPNGTEKKNYLKVLIWILEKEGSEATVADYGKPNKGEGVGSVIGLSLPREFNQGPNRSGFKEVLRQIANTQAKPDDREAVTRMERAREMGAMLDADKRLGAWPKVISSVEDLSEEQIDAVLKWAQKVKEGGLGAHGVIYPGLRGKHAKLEFDQPSTRTNAASHIACRDVLGMEVDEQNLANSSNAKGESPASSRLTLGKHHFDVVLTRTKSFEDQAEAWSGDESAPNRISLGGNEHHPTQTLGELLTLMNHFGCNKMTLQELREKTRDNPPTLVFMGHTKNKRADKALMRFIIKYLPDWKIQNWIPESKRTSKTIAKGVLKYFPNAPIPRSWLDEDYDPKIEGKNYTLHVDPNLNDQAHLAQKLSEANPSIIYTSNAEGTSGDNGKGDGKKKVNYHLSQAAMESVPHARLMHPLPASQDAEIEDTLLAHEQSLIGEQMEGKIAIIASLVAHQLH